MANKVVNRAKMSVTGTPGTSTFTLNAAVTNFQTFLAAGVANLDTVGYLAEGGAGVEIGVGTYTTSGTTLTRTVIYSTNANAAVNFGPDVQVTATALAQDISRPLDRQVFTASGTWTKPKGYGANAMALIEGWGGGGSGAKYGAPGAPGGSGGGGGGYNSRWVPLASLGATETVTVGAGGASATALTQTGNVGGTSSFGSWLSAFGGGPGDYNNQAGGCGGGPVSAGGIGGTSPVVGQPPMMTFMSTDASTYWTNYYAGQGGEATVGGQHGGLFHGGGGSWTTGAGSAINGGGGGGGGTQASPGTAGTSKNGGNGGAAGLTGVAGSAPGGGGGASLGTGAGNSGAGARGEIRITVFDGV